MSTKYRAEKTVLIQIFHCLVSVWYVTKFNAHLVYGVLEYVFCLLFCKNPVEINGIMYNDQIITKFEIKAIDI